jgi:ubiquinone/menaquinone biosynthesis C-methylase UbiE
MMNPAEFANIANSEASFWWYRGMRRLMFGLLDRPGMPGPGAKVLEAGCGTGHFAKVLRERYGWKMYPLDLGWRGLQFARHYGLKRLTQGDIATLPYGDGAFDAVVSMDVVVHFPRGEEDKPLAEFRRVLRPGGLLAIRVSALDVLRSRHSEFAHERQRFTKSRLVGLLRDSGFQVRRCTYANSLLLPVSLMKFRVWEPLTNSAPASGVMPVPWWLDRLLYSPLALEAAAIRAGMNFPVGQSLIAIARRA